MSARIAWSPNPGPQTFALANPALELLYGGTAGSGKSDFLLAGGLRHIQHPRYRAIAFRRTFKELESSLIDRSRQFFPEFGGEYNEQKHFWAFPSGARFYFSHLEHETDALTHKSAEYQYIAFDELTSFTEFQYTYLFSRARSSVGIPIEIRSGSNPEPNWVLRRFAPWVDKSPEYTGYRAKPGEILWFKKNAEDIEEIVPAGTRFALSRTFWPARLSDNPFYANDEGYMAKLMALDPVQRARLLDGDWNLDYAPGLFFQKAWFKLASSVPLGSERVRAWDRAATEVLLDKRTALKPEAKNDPDWSVGLLLARDRWGAFYVEDVVRFRGRPGEVKKRILEVSEDDKKAYGDYYEIVLEQEPGASGQAEIDEYLRALAAYAVHPERHSSNKIARARASSSQAEARNIHYLQASWNDAFFQELERFPKTRHDDQVDALAMAYNRLASRTFAGATGSSTGAREANDLGGF